MHGISETDYPAGLLLGRKIVWNPETETIANDPEATRMLSTPMRAPWHV